MARGTPRCCGSCRASLIQSCGSRTAITSPRPRITTAWTGARRLDGRVRVRYSARVRVWLHGTAAIDTSSLPPETTTLVRSSLTIPKIDYRLGPQPTPFFLDNGDGWIQVPRGWLLNAPAWLPRPHYLDNRSDGQPLPIGTRVCGVTFGEEPYPSGQPAFIQAIVDGCLLNGHGGLALAPTRAGKTLCALEAACKLGRSTLVLVTNAELLKQWKREIEDNLRVECGVIREKQFEVGYPFTVAMAQTLIRRQLPPEARRAWGTVIVDECSVVPCPLLFTALSRLSSRYVIGLTATPDRKDGLTEAIGWMIGPLIASLYRKLDADVHWMPFYWTAEQVPNCSSPVQVDSWLMEDVSRVNNLATEVMRGLAADRRVLMMATRVEHCRRLAAAVYDHHNVPVDLLVGGACMKGMTNPVTVATYAKAEKGLDFDPPHTLFIPAGPVKDIRQAAGRALQPQVPHRTMILDPVDLTPQLIKWAEARAEFYASRGFAFRNDIPRRVA